MTVWARSEWTDERTARCLKLWLEGLSGTQVARQLGGVSRNAVIGKVYRAGLLGRARPSSPGKAPREPRVPRLSRPKSTASPKPKKEPDVVSLAPSLPNDRVFALTPDARPLIGRPFGVCAWPVGEPERPGDQLCCGARALVGRPYCPEHAKAGRMKNGFGIFSPGPDALMRLARKVA